MKKSQYRWVKPKEEVPSEKLVDLMKEFQIQPLFQPYITKLGLQTKKDFEQFFKPQLTDLEDPFLLYEMEKAVKRIQEAIEKQEKILIYGDYDADGITSTTVLKETIENIGGDVVYYLPNRFKDGYGPNQKVYQEFIDFGIQLIITVDNGVAGHEAIAYAKSKGVDVIVTDHHELPETLPEAYAIIHPRHPKGNYPFKDLAGVGVSFKVACALLGEVPIDLLELVAIGTVADLVPLVGENRTLVKLGLQQMTYTERIGLHSLFQVAGISFDELSEESIGFQIAPRLNALGRLEDASVGVELLTTFDEEEAQQLSEKINQINETRKELVEKATTFAFEKIKEAPLAFVYDSSFHEGIVGIVAGKLKQATQSPAFVLTINEKTGLAKGSARSIEAFDLFKNLQKIKDLFTAFGGHQMAAGFSLKIENLETFKEKITELYVEEIAGKDLRETYAADFTLNSTNELTKDLVENLKVFAPFGTNHEKPHFLVEEGAILNPRRIGTNQAHLKFNVKKDGKEVGVIAFQKGSELEELTSGKKVSILADASLKQWNGQTSVQLSLIDYKVNDYQLFDCRKDPAQLKRDTSENYLIWDEKTVKRLHLPKEQVIFYQDFQKLSPEKNYLLIDCPLDLKQAQKFFKESGLTRLYLHGFSHDQAYLNGLPSREIFMKVYKFLRKQENLDVRYRSKEIAKYLNLSEAWFIFIIQVFLEVKFVKIKDGLLNTVENPAPQKLEETATYKRWQKEMQVEEFLLYSSLQDIRNWLENKEDNVL